MCSSKIQIMSHYILVSQLPPDQLPQIISKMMPSLVQDPLFPFQTKHSLSFHSPCHFITGDHSMCLKGFLMLVLRPYIVMLQPGHDGFLA